MALGFLQDSAGDHSSGRLICVLLSVADVLLVYAMVALLVIIAILGLSGIPDAAARISAMGAPLGAVAVAALTFAGTIWGTYRSRSP